MCDDPTDPPYRELQIKIVNDNLDIPLTTIRGTICGLTSRVPTEDEINTLPRYVLTSDMVWDPKEYQRIR